MAEAVYVLCALTSLACAVLLLRSFVASRRRLLLWGGLCFACLMLNNIMLIVDKVLVGSRMDLSLYTKIPAVIGLALFAFGLVWEEE